MPKKKVIIEGQIHIDDKGTLKKSAKGAHSVDRRLKGAAKTSSNASKNFSKMSQGISGGLVPAYATLAASLFALDAVYRGLKEAADLRILQQGQEAYAAATGIAMGSVAHSIQLATDSQISFKEASQAAAIGLAAGLGAEQMERLAGAATGAAKVLGRSVPDAFDRMVRGVVKAEPEVLDELGIILRLDVATRNYAQALGVHQDSLTTYEKSQAVLNEVLSQAETKYSAVAESIQPNTWQQLGVALEKVKDTMMIFIDTILSPVADFLAGNALAAVGAMGVFIASILKGLIPSYAEQAAAFKASQDIQQAEITETINKMNDLKRAKEGRTEGQAMAVGGAQRSMAGAKGKYTGGLGKLQAGKNINAQEAQKILNTEKRKNSQLNKMSADRRKNVIRHLKAIVREEQTSVGKIKTYWQTHFLKTKAGLLKVKVYHKTIMKSMTRAANFAGKAMSRAMAMMGWLSMILMVVQGIRALIDHFKETDEEAEALKEQIKATNERLKTLNTDLGKMAKKMDVVKEKWAEGGQAISFYSNTLKNIPFQNLTESLEASGKVLDEELTTRLFEMGENLEKIMPGIKTLTEEQLKSKDSAQEWLREINHLTGVMGELDAAIKGVTNNEEKLGRMRKKRVDAAVKGKYRDEAVALEENVRSLSKLAALEEKNNTNVTVYADKLDKAKTALKDILNLEYAQVNAAQDLALAQAKGKLIFGAASKYRKMAVKDDEYIAKLKQNQVDLQKLEADEKLMSNKLDLEKVKINKQIIAIKREEIIIEQTLNELRQTLEYEMETAARTGFASGLKKGLQDFLQGKGDFKDLIRGVGEAMAAAMASALAGRWAEKITAGMFGPAPEERAIAKHVEAMDAANLEIERIGNGLTGKIDDFKLYDKSVQDFVKNLDTVGDDFINGLHALIDRIEGKKQFKGGVDTRIPTEEELKAGKYLPKNLGTDVSGETKELDIDNQGQLKVVDENLALINEDTSDMMKWVFQAKSARGLEASGGSLIMDILSNFWGVKAKLDTPGGGASGGYVTKKGIRGFREGGVVPGKYSGKDSVPAMLAPGEVVLTPNQLKGLQGGVQNNQVNVGITMNNNSKGQAQVSGDMMKGIGALIGTKIQQTLLEEARPGGMLSADNRGI